MGRFSVQFDVVNYDDIANSRAGVLPPEKIRRLHLAGLVDTGATHLVLPASAVTALGLAESGQVTVRLGDGQQVQKAIVKVVQVEILNRSEVFSAIVEPGRNDALIGAIVLEQLDLVVDTKNQTLVPRDPLGIIAEM